MPRSRTWSSPSACRAEQLQRDRRFRDARLHRAAARRAGIDLDAGGAEGGPKLLARFEAGQLGSDNGRPVWSEFAAWEKPAADDAQLTPAQREFRASVARGARVFRDKTFLITDSAGINSPMGFGNPVRNSCVFCHNMTQMGNDVAPGQVDLGTTTLPFADPAPHLPLFRITCLKEPHPHYGRMILTQDPGFALTTGRCADVGKITLQSMRGLAARAPYFSNGWRRTCARGRLLRAALQHRLHRAGKAGPGEPMARFDEEPDRALALCAVRGASAFAAEQEMRFVSCPIYRDADAGRKSGCWLTDDAPAARATTSATRPPSPTGITPCWSRASVAEAGWRLRRRGAGSGARIRAGRSCTRHMLPAEGYPGRRFVLPPRNVRPMSEARPVPPKPWTDRVFSLVFDFNRSFAVYQLDDFLLDQAITYIRAVKPRRIIITGYAATTPAEISGKTFAEKPEVADDRAQFALESLRRLGVDPAIIEVHTKLKAEPRIVEGADGLIEPSRRRVDIDVRL